MQQLTCTGPGKLAFHDVPAPTLQGDGEALVRPLAVARCDIDLALLSGTFPLRGAFAVGHECVAEIVALGDAVRGLAVGQRVVVSFQLSCGRCGACSAGYSARCEAYPVLSDYGMQPLSGVDYGGMLSDLVRVPHAAAMLRPIPDRLDPVALASVSDNVLDGFRAVAPHLAACPGARVLVVAHGLPSVPLYAVQAAVALGASRVDFASSDETLLAHAARLGARPVATDFEKRGERYPIVVEGGLSEAGLRYAVASTAPDGVLQSVSFYPQGALPLPLGKLYTLGFRLAIGRCSAVSELPRVLPLIESGALHPEAVTTRVVDWSDAPSAWLEPATKLVVRRAR